MSQDPKPKYRPPTVRDLPTANMAAPVALSDIKAGAQWPPRRCTARMYRMEKQYQASKGNFTYFIPDMEERTRQYNRIGAVLGSVKSLLLVNEPEIDDKILRKALTESIEKLIYDMYRHGRGVVIGYGDTIKALDIRNTFPLESNASLGWVSVETRTTTASSDGLPDVITFIIWYRETGELGGEIWSLRGNKLGEKIGSTEVLRDVRLEVVDYGPVEDNWGSPPVDDMIPVAAEFVRRDSSMSASLGASEIPLAILKAAVADMKTLRNLVEINNMEIQLGRRFSSEDPDAKPTAEDLQIIADNIPRHGLIVLPKGISDMVLLHNPNSLEASFANYAQLKTVWTQITGLSSAEAGDSGNTESGIAYSRRDEKFVMKGAILKNIIQLATELVLGRDFEWEFFSEAAVPDPQNPEPTQGLPTGDPDA